MTVKKAGNVMFDKLSVNTQIYLIKKYQETLQKKL